MLTLKSVRRALMATAIALPLTVVMPATPAHAADPPIGSCGIGREDRGNYWYYSVRNCHDTAVNRRVVFDDGNDGKCRHYEPGQQKNFTSVRKPVDLVGCSDPS